MSTPAPLDRIGVGIDTARYGHRVSFLKPDRQPAAKPLTVMEDRAGYQDSAEPAPTDVAVRDRSALPPEPVNCRFPSADTRGKSARFRAG